MTTVARPRLRSLLLVALVAIAVVGTAMVVGRSGRDTAKDRPELQRVLDGLVTGPARIAPGAAAYVAGPHGTWTGSAGLADLRTRAPMRPDARVRLESVSKIYTAALIASLAADGRLRTSDTVGRWLPRLLPYGDRLTIRQLLTMRSGLIDNNDLVADGERYLRRVEDGALRAQLIATARRWDREPALEFSPMIWIRFAAWQPLLFTPGTSEHYSNIGYEILGLIAERAGGARLPALYRQRILAPLQLRQTAYDPQGPIAGPHATGYHLTLTRRATDLSAAHGGIGAEGGIVADARDTATFLTALMRGRLFGGDRVALLRGADLWRGGTITPCGGRAFGWSGGGMAYKTNVWVSADGSRVAVLLLNGRVEEEAGDGTSASAMARLYCAA